MDDRRPRHCLRRMENRMTQKRKSFPSILKHTWGNWRVFKADKRNELKTARKALDRFMMGCAYIPRKSYSRFNRIRADMEILQQELSCKEWGR